MTELFYDKYEGEMFFDIENIETDSNKYKLTLSALYNGETVGFEISIPVVIRKSLFKTFKLVMPSGQVELSSSGENSDRFVCAIETLLKPAYKSTKKFSEQIETLDFSILNKELYDLDNDKIYLKIYNAEDQSDFEEDEKINLEMNFSFNLNTKRASLYEIRDGYSADLVAVLMR